MRNLPDLAALFDGGPGRARVHLSDIHEDGEGDAAALMESEETRVPEPVEKIVPFRAFEMVEGAWPRI